LGESVATALALSVPLLPAVGVLTRTLAFFIAGIPGAFTVASSASIGELAILGLASSAVAILSTMVFRFAPLGFGSPGAKWMNAVSAPFRLPRALMVVWIIVIAVSIGLPGNLVGLLSGLVGARWTGRRSVDVYYGLRSVVSVLPALVFLLASGIVVGGMNGYVGVNRASVARDDPEAGGALVRSSVVILGVDSAGYWLEECSGRHRVVHVRGDDIRSIELAETDPMTPQATVIGLIFRHERIQIGYTSRC
jgi:hypothetical protein